MNINKLINTPLSGDDMLLYNPDSVLCRYTDLYIYNNRFYFFISFGK